MEIEEALDRLERAVLLLFQAKETVAGPVVIRTLECIVIELERRLLATLGVRDAG